MYWHNVDLELVRECIRIVGAIAIGYLIVYLIFILFIDND